MFTSAFRHTDSVSTQIQTPEAYINKILNCSSPNTDEIKRKKTSLHITNSSTHLTQTRQKSIKHHQKEKPIRSKEISESSIKDSPFSSWMFHTPEIDEMKTMNIWILNKQKKEIKKRRKSPTLSLERRECERERVFFFVGCQ